MTGASDYNALHSWWSEDGKWFCVRRGPATISMDVEETERLVREATLKRPRSNLAVSGWAPQALATGHPDGTTVRGPDGSVWEARKEKWVRAAPDWPPAASHRDYPIGHQQRGSTGQLWEVGELGWKRVDKAEVDRANTTLVDGRQVTPEHREIDPATGLQKDYVVLSAEERAKGFVRPVRDAYRHLKCGAVTTMARPLAETYARDPFFYSGTFCSTCRSHFPVGEDGEFIWINSDGGDGGKVGT